MYDFVIYIFFATIIAQHFFPASSYYARMLFTFSVFALGYLLRPFGGLLFGYFGDRSGRKKSLFITIIIMGLATTLIGCLPTYQNIGISATIAFVTLRILQGIAVGGELPGAITMIAETSPANKRGLNCSLIYLGVNFGMLFASGLATLLFSILSQPQLIAWGWRIVFINSLLLLLLGLYFRIKISESPVFEHMEKNNHIHHNPLLSLLRKHKIPFLICIGLSWIVAVIIAQLFLYMPHFLQNHSILSHSQALLDNTISLLVFTCLIPVMGHYSDHFGRKPIIFCASLLFIFATKPLYLIIAHSTNHLALLMSLFCFDIFAAMMIGTIICTLAEQFNSSIRYSGIALSYNIGFAVFAGLTPLLCTFLLHHFSDPSVISYNLIVGSLISACITFPMFKLLKEPIQLP